MGIENKTIIGNIKPDKKATDVTALSSGEKYTILAEIGPFYVAGNETGVVLRRIVVPETGDAIVVVRESGKPPRLRTSMAVLPLNDDLSTPRPAYYPLPPGIRP